MSDISLNQIATLQQAFQTELQIQRHARNASEVFLTDEKFAHMLGLRQAEELDRLDFSTSINGTTYLNGVELELGQALASQGKFGFSYTMGEVNRSYAYVESFISGVRNLFSGDIPPRVAQMISVARSMMNDIFMTRQGLKEEDKGTATLSLSTKSFLG